MQEGKQDQQNGQYNSNPKDLYPQVSCTQIDKCLEGPKQILVRLTSESSLCETRGGVKININFITK